MSKILIICTETKNNANTDDAYINKLLKTRYNILSDNQIKIAFVHFKGKGNFEKKNIKNQIKMYLSQNFDEKHVLYCVDTDGYDVSPDDVTLNANIQNYCTKNTTSQTQYHYVWFCKTIEEVFWKQKICDRQKKEYSKKFNSDQLAKSIPSLSKENMSKYKSNILLVLDKILPQKDPNILC